MHDFQFFERARLEALLELEYQHEVQRAQVSSYYLSDFASFSCLYLKAMQDLVIFDLSRTRALILSLLRYLLLFVRAGWAPHQGA
jgi:hypothetical protein